MSVCAGYAFASIMLSLCALVVAGAESSLAGAEQQWNDAMKLLDDKLQASPSPLDSCILFPLDPWPFLTSVIMSTQNTLTNVSE